MASKDKLMGIGYWKHVDGGLSLSKKRLGEFLYACLKHNIDMGTFWAFTKYDRTRVLVPVYLTIDKENTLMQSCPWLVLIDPPKVVVN